MTSPVGRAWSEPQPLSRIAQGHYQVSNRRALTRPFDAKHFDRVVRIVQAGRVGEPNYVVYRRLYFEDKNSERYGWDLGPIQPLVSTLCFFKDVALWPHNFASYPCRRFDTSAGQCLPGDPVPYICYPPEFTTAGLLAEAGVIGLLYVAVP